MFESPMYTRIPLVPVPPPDTVSSYSEGDALGLVAGLRPEVIDHQCRCYWCRKMYPTGSTMVWIPDSVMAGDDPSAIAEQCRRSAYNGNFLMICLSCAPHRPGYIRPGGWRDFLRFLIGRGNV